jgi:hypothetical protein
MQQGLVLRRVPARAPSLRAIGSTLLRSLGISGPIQ